MHSMLGEAGDKLSQASVSDLAQKTKEARSDPSNSDSGLRSLLFQLPGINSQSLSRDMDNITASRAGQPGGKDPNSSEPGKFPCPLQDVKAEMIIGCCPTQ